MLGINWTTVVSSAVVACIIGGFQLIANRYTTRLLDRIENTVKAWKNGNGKKSP